MLAQDAKGDGALTLAIACYARGDMAKAGNLFRKVLQQDPKNAIANHQLGLLAFADGDTALAATHLLWATEANPGDGEYQNNFGVVLHARGNFASARNAFEAAISLDAQSPHTFNNLGACLVALSDQAGAIRAFRRAIAMDPGFVEARDNLDRACLSAAPAWHFPMMADAARNAAYDAALRKVAKDCHVLDIGSGSGLLAMMAARAAAASVTTCEVVPAVATTAQAIIAANGFSDTIVSHAKRSDALVIGADMAQRADVLVTEIFSSGLLTEGVLPTLAHAHQNLLAPDAVVIPQRAVARGYLIGGDAIECQASTASVAGFDLSGFNVFATCKFALHLDRFPHDILSDDFDILAFDLTRAGVPPGRRELVVTARKAGRCMGVAQWIQLDLDAEITYENRPTISAGANGWMHIVYRFPRPVDLKQGDQVRLIANHTATELTVALANDV
jgi:type II protein arginine methyltransferase